MGRPAIGGGRLHAACTHPIILAHPQSLLSTRLQTFGPVRSCRLVVDKDSGKLKGTAFVDFYRVASAHAAAEACAKGRCEGLLDGE